MAVAKKFNSGDLALVVDKTDSGYAVGVYDLRDVDLPDAPDPAAVRSEGDEMYATVKGGLFESEQRNREFINAVTDALPSALAQGFSDEFETWAHEVATRAEKRREVQRTENVARLLRETASVTVYPGEETYRRVELEHDGRTERIEFTSGEWTADSPAPLRERYDSVFYEPLDVDADEWRTLREEWTDMQEVKEPETLTGATMLAETVRDVLASELKPYSERDRLVENQNAAWYVDAEESDLVDAEANDSPPGVVYVRSKTVRRWLRSEGGDSSDIGELAREWRDDGTMLATTERKRVGGARESLWPLAPTPLRIDPEFDVYYPEDGGEE